MKPLLFTNVWGIPASLIALRISTLGRNKDWTAFVFVTLSTSAPNSEGRNLYTICTMHTRQITYNTLRSSFGNSLEMGCVHFVCNIFHFTWKWVVFHFVCIYMKKLHSHLFTRDKFISHNDIAAEKRTHNILYTLSDTGFLNYKNYN